MPISSISPPLYVKLVSLPCQNKFDYVYIHVNLRGLSAFSSSTFYWLIHNPTDTGYIRLEVQDSRLEADPYCSYDKVTVYRGEAQINSLVNTFIRG